MKLKIKASKYKITSIKKIWINYQIDFNNKITIDDLKEFLKLDKEVKFSVINVSRLRSKTNNFANEEKFLQYILQVFNWNIWKKKIKLKRKS